MLSPTPETPSATAEITAMDLRFMPLDDLVSLFHRLPAPSFEEMHGEFAATLLEQGSGRAFITAQVALNINGRWLCKAFEPTGPNEGHGYNSFMTPRGVRRAVRMRTRIGASRIPGDSNDSFHLEYADLNDFKRGGPGGAFVHTMFDELRKAAPGLYLGIGRVGFTKKQLAELHPFILEGPVADFVAHR
ncbi:MAG: hypothetical protein WBM48_10105 [Polyangiales bacterium]|jgi:hypothetical protein